MNRYLEKIAGYDKSSTVKKYKTFLKHFGLEPEKACLIGDSGAVVHGVAGRAKGIEIGLDSETFANVERVAKLSRSVEGGEHSLALPKFGVTAKLQKHMVAHRGEIVGGVQAPALNTFTQPSQITNNRYTEKANKLLHERAKKDVKRQGELQELANPQDSKSKAKPASKAKKKAKKK